MHITIFICTGHPLLDAAVLPVDAQGPGHLLAAAVTVDLVPAPPDDQRSISVLGHWCPAILSSDKMEVEKCKSLDDVTWWMLWKFVMVCLVFKNSGLVC